MLLSIVALAAGLAGIQPTAAGPDLSFLTGNWLGREGGEVHEEQWSAVQGGGMMGMYRWIDATGKPRMFELLSLGSDGGPPVMRIRHFNGDFAAREERPILVHWTGGGPRKAIFTCDDVNERLERLTYDAEKPGVLSVLIEFRAGAGREPITVMMQRAGAAAGSTPAPASAAKSKAVFEKIKSLTGQWEGKSTKGWTEKVNYQTIAGGSCVLESSFEAHPGEMMTSTFCPDGDRLLLTHYCVAKNQPRLVLTDAAEDGSAATFEFLDATNLPGRDKGHMDKVVFRFIDADHFTSRWTWYQDGQERWMEEIEHRRAGK